MYLSHLLWMINRFVRMLNLRIIWLWRRQEALQRYKCRFQGEDRCPFIFENILIKRVRIIILCRSCLRLVLLTRQIAPCKRVELIIILCVFLHGRGSYIQFVTRYLDDIREWQISFLEAWKGIPAKCDTKSNKEQSWIARIQWFLQARWYRP
jgi:hypothetical protein